MEKHMIIILIAFVLVISLLVYFLICNRQESFSSCDNDSENSHDHDNAEDDEQYKEENFANVEREIPACTNGNIKENFEPVPSDPMDLNENQLTNMNDDPIEGNMIPNECFPKDSLTPEELLPNQKATTWSKANPSGTGKLSDQNFLHAGFHVGINTVGQSLRNANLQLRSEPPNPTKKVGPWMQSTIEPDLNRLPLEISS